MTLENFNRYMIGALIGLLTATVLCTIATMNYLADHSECRPQPTVATKPKPLVYPNTVPLPTDANGVAITP